MAIYDHFGKDASLLRGKRLFLLDMDGTIYREDRLFDGTKELLRRILDIGGRYVFITNNSSKSVADYVKKVGCLGIAATEDCFFTSAQATAMLLRERYPNETVYCQGTKSLLRELTSYGIRVTEQVTDEVGVILVGFDTELTSQKLRNTCELLLRDIPFYATNPDLVCPVSFGYVPDCGSICMMLKNATGREPVYIGKPAPMMIDIARKTYRARQEETVVIGDRLYTDIAAGVNAGVTSICVLTGEATEQDILTGEIKPTYTMESVKSILQAIGEDEGKL